MPAIAAGEAHTVALKSDGTVIAWGRNSSGQTSVPAGLTGVTAIAAGTYHSVALWQAAPALTAATPPTTSAAGDPYVGYTFTASGAPTPIFTIVNGALPAGLTLSSAGVLSGAPTAAGTATFTIQASNGVGTPAVSSPITVTITAPPVSTPPVSAPPTPTSFTPPTSPPTSDGPLTLEASRLTPGQQFTAAGGGYAPGSTVTLVIYSDPATLTTATTTDLGDVSLTATIPTNLAHSSHTLVAYGTALDGSTHALTATIKIAEPNAPAVLAHTGTDLGVLALSALTLLTAGTTTLLVRRRTTATSS